jgi:hypothetical protein
MTASFASRLVSTTVQKKDEEKAKYLYTAQESKETLLKHLVARFAKI